ncbi:50S ribosomal protein L4 [Sulfolobales archaeon HS-7]|nr:50S ribosomal protein L4 [Sulfolobales archaeon HS-7]
MLELEKRKTVILSKNGEERGDIELPLLFSYPVRRDLIRRAFFSSFSKSIQPKGRDSLAGKRTPAKSFGIGLGRARVPRIESGEARLAPMVVGGRLAFPPSVDRKIEERINRKEMRKAITSAISATGIREYVTRRGHLFEVKSLPIVMEDEIEKVNKTAEFVETLKKIGVYQDLIRVEKGKKIRPGKGKMRGRRYKVPVGPLVVVSKSTSELIKAARNLLGVSVIYADALSVIHLAPGGEPGRLTIYSVSSIDKIKERLEV